MTQAKTDLNKDEATAQRATDLFYEQQQSIYRHTDRIFAVLMIMQWLAGIAAAYWISPKTWIGASSQTHLHVWAALFLGGAISLFPVMLALLRPGAAATRYCIATAQMLMSALLIHLTGGRIETHFHVFGSLAFLSFYRDWRVLIPATAVVAADHFLRGVFWPQSVYGVIMASQWRWLEHAGWVLFEDTVLCIAIKRSVSEMRDIAIRTAEIKDLNEGLEIRVHERTAQLAAANLELEKEVDERKRAEEALRESQELFQSFMSNGPMAAYMKDEEGRLIYANPVVERLFESAPGGLVGKTDFDVLPAETATQLRENDLAVLNAGRVVEFLETIPQEDGERQWMTFKFPFTDASGRRLLAGMSIDITEHKRAEEALRRSEEQLRQSQKMESVGTLAGGVAHDFNNLLTSILGNTQLAISRLEPDSPLQHRLLEIEKAANRAATLTRQLLAFSRRQQLERKLINPNDTIGDLMKMLQRILGEDIEVRLQVTPNLKTVFVDPAQIEQVIMNLVVNARDAMPGGGLLVIGTHNVTLDEAYCRNHPYAKPGAYVQITVSDTGCGMSAELQRHIFEPFFTTKEVGKGTGLGLAMIYGIVKQHDGLIEVYSEVGKGTTFKIYLPADQRGVQQETLEAQPQLRGGTETILVAEDEEMLRELAHDVLRDLGYQVMLAKDGAEAVEIYASNCEQIDLVLLDVVMPRMSGHEAYKRISALAAGVPSIFMTGYSTEIAQSMFFKNTGAILIQKPYSVEVLGRKIREVLDATKQ